MPKTSIEELIEAVAAVQILKVAIVKQDETIILILNRLDAIEQTLASRTAP